MKHPETLPPETLRQMGIKELREREEFLKKQISSFSLLVSTSKSLLTSLPAQIEKLEGGQYPPNSLEMVYSLPGNKYQLARYTEEYPKRVVKLQTAEDELAAVHRELEWRQAERQLAQRGALLAAPSALLGFVPKGKAR